MGVCAIASLTLISPIGPDGSASTDPRIGPTTEVSSSAPGQQAHTPAARSGSLRILVSGDRLGKRTKVVVRGLGGKARGYRKVLKVRHKRTLTGLSPGRYRVAAASITSGTRTAKSTRRVMSVRVIDKRIRTVRHRYSRWRSGPGRHGQNRDFVVYTPRNYDPYRGSYPTIIAFDPSQESSRPGIYDSVLRETADRHGLLVLTSRYYRNGEFQPDGATKNMAFDSNCRIRTIGGAYATQRSKILRAMRSFPIDRSRVIFLGFSGGGSMAHALNIRYPGMADAIVANTSMIWGEEISEATGRGEGTVNVAPWKEFMQSCRTAADYSKSRRLAAFLTSNGDFRQAEMLGDIRLYGSLVWRAAHYPFVGGHRIAPADVYARAIGEIVADPAWR